MSAAREVDDRLVQPHHIAEIVSTTTVASAASVSSASCSTHPLCHTHAVPQIEVVTPDTPATDLTSSHAQTQTSSLIYHHQSQHQQDTQLFNSESNNTSASALMLMSQQFEQQKAEMTAEFYNTLRNPCHQLLALLDQLDAHPSSTGPTASPPSQMILDSDHTQNSNNTNLFQSIRQVASLIQSVVVERSNTAVEKGSRIGSRRDSLSSNGGSENTMVTTTAATPVSSAIPISPSPCYANLTPPSIVAPSHCLPLQVQVDLQHPPPIVLPPAIASLADVPPTTPIPSSATTWVMGSPPTQTPPLLSYSTPPTKSHIPKAIPSQPPSILMRPRNLPPPSASTFSFAAAPATITEHNTPISTAVSRPTSRTPTRMSAGSSTLQPSSAASSFVSSFSSAMPPPPSSSSPSSSALSKFDVSGLHILIVDDMSLNRKVLRKMLESIPAVDSACDGLEAVQMVRNKIEAGLRMQLPPIQAGVVEQMMKENLSVFASQHPQQQLQQPPRPPHLHHHSSSSSSLFSYGDSSPLLLLSTPSPGRMTPQLHSMLLPAHDDIRREKSAGGVVGSMDLPPAEERIQRHYSYPTLSTSTATTPSAAYAASMLRRRGSNGPDATVYLPPSSSLSPSTSAHYMSSVGSSSLSNNNGSSESGGSQNSYSGVSSIASNVLSPLSPRTPIGLPLHSNSHLNSSHQRQPSFQQVRRKSLSGVSETQPESQLVSPEVVTPSSTLSTPPFTSISHVQTATTPSAASTSTTSSTPPILPQYDVIITDLSMPKLNGLQEVQLIRQLEAELNLPNIPIIAVTSNTLASDRLLCAKHEFTYFLAKPFQRKDILSILELIVHERTIQQHSLSMLRKNLMREQALVQAQQMTMLQQQYDSVLLTLESTQTSISMSNSGMNSQSISHSASPLSFSPLHSPSRRTTGGGVGSVGGGGGGGVGGTMNPMAVIMHQSQQYQQYAHQYQQQYQQQYSPYQQYHHASPQVGHGHLGGAPHTQVDSFDASILTTATNTPVSLSTTITSLPPSGSRPPRSSSTMNIHEQHRPHGAERRITPPEIPSSRFKEQIGTTANAANAVVVVSEPVVPIVSTTAADDSLRSQALSHLFPSVSLYSTSSST